MLLSKDEIRAEAELVVALHTGVHTTFAAKSGKRPTQQDWSEAARKFREHEFLFDTLRERAFLDRVIERDGDERETALRFLEVDPWCYWSGYTKEKICRAIGRAALTKNQLERVRGIVLMIAKARPRTEIRSYCRLAARVANDQVIAALETVTKDRGHAARHASWMLDRIHAHPENRRYDDRL